MNLFKAGIWTILISAGGALIGTISILGGVAVNIVKELKKP